MRVLITGVSGFIGPHIAEACLKKGWDVLGVDLLDFDYNAIACDFHIPQFVFEKRDVRSLTEEDLAGITYIFHLAFVTNIPNSIREPLATTIDNVGIEAFLFDLAKKIEVKKLVFATTASLYGNNPTPWREDMPPYPIEPYSWQKLCGEYALKTWSACFGLQSCGLRLFQVFGENQRKDTAMAAFFRARKEGKPITLTETTAQSSFRTGQRDFIYVKDVARAFVLAAESEKTGKGEIINVGTGKVTTMEDIAKTIGGEVIFIPRRGFEVERHEADITRARELLGWEPSVEVIPWLTEFVKTL